MSSSIIDPNAPQALKDATSQGAPALIAWCTRASDSELRDAMTQIYRHNGVYLDCVREEMEERRQKEVERRLDDLKKPHWTVLPNFWLTLLSAGAALIAAYLAWRALKK